MNSSADSTLDKVTTLNEAVDRLLGRTEGTFEGIDEILSGGLSRLDSPLDVVNPNIVESEACAEIYDLLIREVEHGRLEDVLPGIQYLEEYVATKLVAKLASLLQARKRAAGIVEGRKEVWTTRSIMRTIKRGRGRLDSALRGSLEQEQGYIDAVQLISLLKQVARLLPSESLIRSYEIIDEIHDLGPQGRSARRQDDLENKINNKLDQLRSFLPSLSSLAERCQKEMLKGVIIKLYDLVISNKKDFNAVPTQELRELNTLMTTLPNCVKNGPRNYIQTRFTEIYNSENQQKDEGDVA